MRIMPLLGAVAALAVVVSGLASTPYAVAQTTCEWYARTAVKQHQENEQRRCGFTGPAWTSDLKAHMNWCASVSPEEWKKSAQKRDQDLAACAKK